MDKISNSCIAPYKYLNLNDNDNVHNVKSEIPTFLPKFDVVTALVHLVLRTFFVLLSCVLRIFIVRHDVIRRVTVMVL